MSDNEQTTETTYEQDRLCDAIENCEIVLEKAWGEGFADAYFERRPRHHTERDQTTVAYTKGFNEGARARKKKNENPEWDGVDPPNPSDSTPPPPSTPTPQSE